MGKAGMAKAGMGKARIEWNTYNELAIADYNIFMLQQYLHR